MIRLESEYASLPERLFARVRPTPVRAPRLLALNEPLCAALGLDAAALRTPEGVALLVGNAVAEGSSPIAAAYAGHQFGNFVPQLGDGRAILLGERDAASGERFELLLKGAGPTPFSRRGDGRAALGPALREYLVSEAMAALGVPTTRALAVTATGEEVLRDERLPGAVIVRVARSHLRVGTFQYFAARRDVEALAVLARFALSRHDPLRAEAAASAPSEEARVRAAAAALLDLAVEGQAALIPRWLGLGFVHGVMNTDNCAVGGETLDYGPCAFLDEYDPKKRFSSIDHGGRYAFAAQPLIAHWNLARLAEALLPLLDADDEVALRLAAERLDRYEPLLRAASSRVYRAKLGLATEREGDLGLIEDLLARMAKGGADFTLVFRRLCDAAEDPGADDRVGLLFDDARLFAEWAPRWRARLDEEATAPAERARGMRRVSPAFIPRNHRVEHALARAAAGDLAPFERLHRVLARPYDDQPADADLSDPPHPRERVRATFCGT